MSALGHEQTYAVQYGMSALPPKVDMCAATKDVRFGPIADLVYHSRNLKNCHFVGNAAQCCALLSQSKLACLQYLRYLRIFDYGFCCTAQRHAATEFRAGHPQHISQHPEKCGVAVDIYVVRVAVDFDGEGHGIVLPSASSNRATRRVSIKDRYPSLVVGCSVSLVRGQTKLRIPSVPLMTLVQFETKLRDSRLQTFRVPYASAHAECRTFPMVGRG